MLPIPTIISNEDLVYLIKEGSTALYWGPAGAKISGIPHYFNSLAITDGSVQFYKDTEHLGITLYRDMLKVDGFKIPTNIMHYDEQWQPVVDVNKPSEVNCHSCLEIPSPKYWGTLGLLNFTGLPFEQPVIVLDLETLSTEPDAVIIQVGAVFGDLATGKISSVFNEHINSNCPYNSKRRTDLDTVTWHLNERRKDPTFHKQMPLETYTTNQFRTLAQTLQRLSAWFNDVANILRMSTGEDGKNKAAPLRILCKGPEFDIKLLEDAYKQADLKTPWNYKNVGSVRTFEHLYVDMRIRQGINCDDAEREIRDFLKGRSLITHDGLFDAITEFELVYEISKLLGTNKPVLE